MFHFVFVERELFAEGATTAVDAVGRGFAGGFHGGHVAEAVFFFAEFAHRGSELLVGFAGEARGDLESVEEGTCLSAVDALGGVRAEDLIDGELHSGGVFSGGKKERLG